MEALDLIDLPWKVLHEFACQCAERALNREKTIRTVPSFLIEAVKVYKLYLQGLAKVEEVRSFNESCFLFASSFSGKNKGSSYAATTWAIASLSPDHSLKRILGVANDSLRAATRFGAEHQTDDCWEKEMDWQTKRLQKLMDLAGVVRVKERTLIERWQEESEEGLF